MASAWERMQQKAKEEQAGRRETAAPAAVASNSAWERMQQKAAVASGAQPASREQRDAGVRESYARRENQAKLDKLRSQHQQLTVDMEFDEAAKVKDEITALEKSMGQHWTDRTVNVLSGAAKQSVGGLSAGISTAYEAGQPGRSAQNEAFRQEQQERYDRAKREYAAMLQDNEIKPGSWSQGDLESSLNIMEDARRKGEAMGLVIDEQIQQKAATAARDFSRDVMASGGKDVEKAKTGLTGAGKFAVDVGVGAAQLAGDALLGAITAGGSLAPLALRTFGSGAEEARAEGATLGQQLAYGAGSAALGVAAEKLFSVSKPFKKMFGPGLLDNAVAKALGRMGQTPTGKLALSAISEGGEEFLEAVFQPVLHRATYNKDASFDLGDALYQAAVGAALGLAGGGVDVALGGKATGTAQEAPPNAAAQRTTQSEGVDMAEKESPAEAPTDPLLRAVLGQQKTAPEVGTVVNVISRQSAINDRSREKNTLAYTLAASIDKVSDMEPVSQLTGRELNEQGRKPSEQIADFFRSLGNKVFRLGLGDVALNDYGIGGMLNHRPLNRAKMVSLAAVPDVIQRGKQIYYDPNWKGRGYPSYIFAAPVTVGNTPVYVAAVVNQNPDNKFYLSEMVDSEGNYVKIEESPSSNSKNGVTDGAGQASGAGITAGPEGLSSGASPSVPNVGTEPVAPVIDSTIAQDADSVNSNTVGAAAAGFETPGSQSVERTSRLAETVLPYTARKGEATARTRQEYDELFRYMSQTEEQSQQAAQNMLYLLVDGQPTFLMDYDPEGYQAITDSLRLAPAWNGVMTDAANLIERELFGRSANAEISEDTYVEWLQTMREHGTAGGQGVQAWAKWSRADNKNGQATRLEAWETLESSNLSESERQERWNAIVMFDRQIEAAQTDADLRQIILDIARQRGTLSGLTGRQSRLLTGLASSALDGLNMAQLRQFAYSSSAALSRDATASNAGQKLKTIQILNMLSNPKTPAKNLAGNTSFYLLDAMTMRGAALLDMALSKITGTRSVAMEGSVLGRESREAIGRAIRMSLAEVTMDVDMGGDSRYQQGGRRTFKAGGTGVLNSNTAADRFAERVLSAIERNMGYLMTTTDEAYKGAARSTQLATQRLVDQGKIKNAGKDFAGEQAEQLALYRTFQNDGKVAAVIRGIHDMLNIVGVGDSGRQVGGQTIHSFGLGDLVAPFTRVAGNLAAVGMDYSPVNAVKGTVEIMDTVRRAAGGSMDPARQAKAVSDFARGMSGSAIAYGVMVLAKAGLIKRAEDEEDEDVAALNQTEGLMGTQVNIDAARRWIEGGDQRWQPGDTLIDMSNLEPLNFIVSLGVELADNQTEGVLSTFTDVNTYGDTVESIKNTAGDLPILSSVGDFATDVLVYHNDPIEAGVEMLGKTAISSVTPNVLAAFAKGWDDKQRSTYSGEGVQDVLLDTLKSRIPGLREQLPTVVNTLGEEKDNPGTLEQRLLNAMLNPIGVNEYSQSAVSQEMERVREETGETGFYPSKSIPSEISATKGGKNKTVELDFEQRQDFQSNRGALTMVTMSALIGKSAYRNADDAAKSELLSDAQSYADQAARARLMGTEWVDKWVKGTIEAQKSTGLDPATVIAYRDMLSRAKESGTTSEANQKVRQTIMADTSMTASQKAALDNIVISDGVYIPKEVNVDYSSNESFVITQMSDGAQGRWKGIKAQFGMDAETYQKAWSIYQDDDLKADEKRAKLYGMGLNGQALYKAFGKKIS